MTHNLTILLPMYAIMIASWIYWILVHWRIRSCFSERRTAEKGSFDPPVSILIPLERLRSDAVGILSRFCEQDYPQYEVIIGFPSPDDSTAAVIKELRERFPDRAITGVAFCGQNSGQESCYLDLLASHARYDLLVVADSGIEVTEDYLEKVVAPLADESTTMVTCAYRTTRPSGMGARLDAMYMDMTLFPLIAQYSSGDGLTIGGTVALRRNDLAKMDFLARSRVAMPDIRVVLPKNDRVKVRMHLSNHVVRRVSRATTIREQWRREANWARYLRKTKPLDYCLLLLTFSIPLSLGLMLVSGFQVASLACFFSSMALRWSVSSKIARYTSNDEILPVLVWLPVGDLLSALAWCAGCFEKAFGDEAEHHFELPEIIPESSKCNRTGFFRGKILAIFRVLIFGIDALLKRSQKIWEFSNKDECLLRLALSRSQRNLQLADGTRITKGDYICELHFWNEHFPAMPKNGPDLAWALTIKRRMINSLRDLAAFSKTEPLLHEVKAFHADTALGSQRGFPEFSGLAKRWGFDVSSQPENNTIGHRIAELFKSIYTTALIWAFNPENLNGNSFWSVRRDHIWISRKTLLQRYAPKPVSNRPHLKDHKPAPRRKVTQRPSVPADRGQQTPACLYTSKIALNAPTFSGLCYESASGDLDDGYTEHPNEHKTN